MRFEGKKVYVAGPMRNHYRFNFPAFDAASEMIRSGGGVPFNPAEMDRSAGFDPSTLPDDYDWSSIPNGFSVSEAFDRDIDAIKAADAIYMLDGWKNSTGACAEHGCALWLGKEVLYEIEPTEDVLFEAHRITSGDRNIQYGDPNIDFKRTAGMWAAYLETEVKPHDVAWMMTMLKASRNRHQCKRDNYVDAAGYIRCGARCEGV